MRVLDQLPFRMDVDRDLVEQPFVLQGGALAQDHMADEGVLALEEGGAVDHPLKLVSRSRACLRSERQAAGWSASRRSASPSSSRGLRNSRRALGSLVDSMVGSGERSNRQA